MTTGRFCTPVDASRGGFQKFPIGSADDEAPNAVLDMVVVYRQRACVPGAGLGFGSQQDSDNIVLAATQA